MMMMMLTMMLMMLLMMMMMIMMMMMMMMKFTINCYCQTKTTTKGFLPLKGGPLDKYSPERGDALYKS